MLISDWSSDVCSSDLVPASGASGIESVGAGIKVHAGCGSHASTSDWRKRAKISSSSPTARASKRLRHVASAEEVSGAPSQIIRLTRTPGVRSEGHTSELQSLMRISYAVFCLKKKNKHLKHEVEPH